MEEIAESSGLFPFFKNGEFNVKAIKDNYGNNVQTATIKAEDVLSYKFDRTKIEKVYNKIDMSDDELEEFIDSLTGEQFENLSNFFETMPKVQHSIEVTNPKTKKKGEVVIECIQSFFD